MWIFPQVVLDSQMKKQEFIIGSLIVSKATTGAQRILYASNCWQQSHNFHSEWHSWYFHHFNYREKWNVWYYICVRFNNVLSGCRRMLFIYTPIYPNKSFLIKYL